MRRANTGEMIKDKKRGELARMGARKWLQG